MFKFAIKSAILGSAVYYSIEKGVWKDSETTTAIYDELEKGMSPYVDEVKSHISYQLPPLPTEDRVSYLFKHYWNEGVKATFKFIVKLPEHATEAATISYDFLQSALENVENTPSEKVEK